MLQDVFMNKVFRVYTSSDIVGIELGGALKNVIALAAGTVDGLGYGDNTKTRGKRNRRAARLEAVENQRHFQALQELEI